MSRTYHDVFYADCLLLDQLSVFTFAYWIYDVVIMYISYCRENQMMKTPFLITLRPFLGDNPLIIVHHIAVVFGGCPLTLHYRFGKAAFMISCVHFTELSAPFLNIRKIFIRHGYTKNLVFKINSAIAVVTFFIARIVLFPSIYLIYAYTYNQTLWEVAKSMYFGCHFVMFLVTVLQTTWFVIFLKTVTKDRTSNVFVNGRQQNGHRSADQNGYQNGRDVGYPKMKKSE
ncbi:TLC domain-containing protein 3A-like [Lytechinus pictus]|uniref:TLC domain-containing protein 3A-like n=1 Tax=Lytechinus pictus TaxID=7653 RepID=UPI00240E3238|nr:TLC domain-containing protein 3A-like [Lytechinus pictus]